MVHELEALTILNIQKEEIIAQTHSLIQVYKLGHLF